MSDNVLEVRVDAEMTLHMDVSDGDHLNEAVENILGNGVKIRHVDGFDIKEVYQIEEY